MNFKKTYQLAFEYYQSGESDQSALICRKILKENPNDIETLNLLGNILLDQEQPDAAIPYFDKMLKIDPMLPNVYYNLGNAYLIKKELDKAIGSYNQALTINPNHADALLNKGTVFQDQGKLFEALECYRLSLQVVPNSVEALNNLGNLLKDLGQINDAESCFRKALQINPFLSDVYSNLLLAINYDHNYDAQSIYSEHVRFARQFAKSLLSSVTLHSERCDYNRRLRIAYVSPDFRRHSVAYFIEPVLAAHRREDFEIFCYSLVQVKDEVTVRMQNYADQWRYLSTVSDEKAAESIREDNIDILIDLAGHTAKNRILLFARKPAPIQVSWIGYPATTGLSTIDYKLVDQYTDPLGMTEQFYTEQLIRMPETFLCYLPDSDSPEVGSLPSSIAGYVSFGSFNNFAKISPEVIALWTKILKVIPNSRLVLKAKCFTDRMTRDYAFDMFATCGIERDRIKLFSWFPSIKEHLNLYNQVDIALDTFPYNGTTTTCEAMWMGVPVVTLVGKTHASRVGLSLLSNFGLKELIAKTHDEYIEIAINLATDLKRLKSLREHLRDIMKRSPLCDAKRFTSNLEICYHKMWETWCKSV